MTRVLYRRYLRGDISEEEWAYRKRQPHFCSRPLNLRPYLDKEWFERGGGSEFMISIGICAHNLPFMTLGETERKTYHADDLPDGAPPFSDLLTFDRFLHRAGLLKKQTEAFVSHPLFSELVRLTPRPVGTANGADKHDNPDDDEVLAVTDVPSVRAYTGTSVGNVRRSLNHLTPYPHAYFPTRHLPVVEPNTPDRIPLATRPSPLPFFSRLASVESRLRYPLSCHRGGHDPENPGGMPDIATPCVPSRALPQRVDVERTTGYARLL